MHISGLQDSTPQFTSDQSVGIFLSHFYSLFKNKERTVCCIEKKHGDPIYKQADSPFEADVRAEA